MSTQDRHYELTSETNPIYGATLYRIRATRDLPAFGVLKGDLGGWIEDKGKLSGSAWVSGNAQVHGNAQVSGNAQVHGNARVYGNAWVYGNAQVSGNAQVHGDAQVSGDARVHGNARVYGNAWVYGDAQVSNLRHILVVGPIGSEGVTSTLHRTTTGHALHVGCWHNGTLDTLPAEVERRAKHWEGSDAQKEAWREQYDALRCLGRATVAQWDHSEVDA